MKQGISWVACLILCLCMVPQIVFAVESTQRSQSPYVVNLENRTISFQDGVSLAVGDDVNKLYGILGLPLSVDKSENGELYFWYFDNHVVVRVSAPILDGGGPIIYEHRCFIRSILIASDQFVTDKCVRIGDSFEKFMNAYNFKGKIDFSKDGEAKSLLINPDSKYVATLLEYKGDSGVDYKSVIYRGTQLQFEDNKLISLNI